MAEEAPAKASLVYEEGGEQLPFIFNPKKITVAKQKKTQNSGVVVNNQEEAVRSTGQLTVTISKILLYGPETQSDVEKLYGWIAPKLEQKEGNDTYVYPKKILFKWGDAFNIPVQLEKVSAEYTRFTSTGKPVRADVDITLKEWVEKEKATNPTSGGAPGGSTHSVIQGDSLASIATGTYGRPGRWRDVAEANRIDDPLRMRFGRTLYLPAPADLSGR